MIKNVRFRKKNKCISKELKILLDKICEDNNIYNIEENKYFIVNSVSKKCVKYHKSNHKSIKFNTYK